MPREYVPSEKRLERAEHEMREAMHAVCGEVVHALRTELGAWSHANPRDVEVRRLAGAMSNHVYACWDKRSGHRALFRLYGHGSEMFFSREEELAVMRALSDAGVGPKLLAAFRNGRIEEWIDGRALTAEDLRDPVISSRIAAAMAKLHQLPPLLVGAEPHRSAEQAPAQLRSKMFDVLEDWLDNASRPHSQLGGEEASVPDAGQEAAGVASRPRVGSEGESSDHGGELFACDAASSPTEHAAAPELSLDVLRQETRCLRELLAAYPSPVVFCHNDLQYGNIMRTRSGDIKLIDFEYSFLNCRAFDIANHFCEWAADYHNDVPHRMDFSRLPSADQRLAFCQSYLDALPGDEKPSAESLLREVEPFTMASHLLWAIWGVIQARGAAPGFDYKEYARGRFERYCEEKRAHEEAAAC